MDHPLLSERGIGRKSQAILLCRSRPAIPRANESALPLLPDCEERRRARRSECLVQAAVDFAIGRASCSGAIRSDKAMARRMILVLGLAAILLGALGCARS